MPEHRRRRAAKLGASLCLALGLVLVTASFVAAQLQLPGTPLTTGPANNLRPAWSPDGTKIAYYSNRSGNNDIWVMDGNGANQQQLTDDPADDRRPAWSPAGDLIAFDSDRAGTRDLWIMNADGSDPVQVTNGPGQDSFASWSPDQTRLAYYAYENGVLDLWVIDVKDLLQGGTAGQPQRVTSGLANERLNQCTFACHVPSWSPDSSWLVYQRMNHSQVWVVGVDGSNPHQVTAHGAHEHYPVWLPDGRIVFLSEHVNVDQEPVNDIWAVDPDGTNAKELFSDIPHGGPLEFKSDGVTIAFHSPRAGNFDIYTTVLGQDMPLAATPAAPAQATVAAPTEEAVGPEAAPTTAASGRQANGLLSPAVIWVVAVLVLGGGAIALFLARRSHAS